MPVDADSVPEVISEAGKESLIEFVVDVIAQTFDDTAYQLTDLPGFVADDNPVGPAANVSRQVTRLACRSYARGGGPQNLPGFDAAWGGVCAPYLESIGEDPLPGGGVSAPFSGGQCPGVNYQISWSWSAGSFNSGPQSAQRVGPLSYNRGDSGIPGCGSGSSYNQLVVVDGTGQSPVSLYAGCDAQLTGISVTPIDPVPDDCGNPDPEYDPPKIRPGLPDVPVTPIDFPGVGPVGIKVEFNPDGTLNVDLPDVGVEVDVPIDFGGDDEGGGGAEPGGGGPPPGDVGSPGSPVAIGPGGEEEGEAPPGSVLVGLRVQVVAFPPSRAKFTEDVFRGAYYVYMGVPNLLDLDFGGAMVRQDQFLFAEKDNLTNWRVSANTGYELITTPYYREVEVE